MKVPPLMHEDEDRRSDIQPGKQMAKALACGNSFILLPDWLMCRPELTTTEKCVYALLHRRQRKGDITLLKATYVARDLSVSRGTVEAGIRKLVALRLIERNGRQWLFPDHRFMDATRPRVEEAKHRRLERERKRAYREKKPRP